MFQSWTAAVGMEVVDSTIKSALKTWQTSSTGRTLESPLWSHDPWTHRSHAAAGRPEKNEVFWRFQKVLIISEKGWSSWKRGLSDLQGETETWSPGTDLKGAHSVCHPHLGNIVRVSSYWRLFGRHFLESQFFLRGPPLPPPSSKRYNCCTGPQMSTIPKYKCDR